MKTAFTALLAAVLAMTASAQTALPREADILASYIEGAAAEHGLDVMCAVGAVIINRCADSGSIVTEGNTLGIRPSPTPSAMARCAAELVLSGVDITDGAVIFFHRSDSALYARFEKLITYSSNGCCFARR